MKRKVIFASALAAVALGAIGAAVYAANPFVSTYAMENWQVGEIDEKYLYGTVFSVPSATVEIGGVTAEATFSVTYPDGKTTIENNVVLDRAGIYTVNYFAAVGNVRCVREEKFTVEKQSWLVKDAKSSVYYGDYSDYGATSSGLIVRLAHKDELSFAKLIDMSSLNGSEHLIDAFITPDTRGVYDFNKLIVTYTDSIDSSVWLRYEIKRYSIYNTVGLANSFVSVAGNGQSQTGWEPGKGYHVNNDSLGTPIDCSFVAQRGANGWSGTPQDYVPDVRKIYFSLNTTTMETRAQGWYMADLDDPECYKEQWKGFPSGKARLTISAAGYNSTTANFCITGVYGIADLSEELTSSTDEPDLHVSIEKDGMPMGKTGAAYTIPAATARDVFAEPCDVKVSVWRDYATETPVSVSVVGGKFLPAVSGWYTVLYTATDARGNIKTDTRNVYIAQNLAALTVTVPSDAQKTASLGEWVEVPVPETSGGSGMATVKASVTHDGVTTEITDGFRPDAEGVWTVVYNAVGYVGETGTSSYEVNAVHGADYVLVGNTVFPEIFISDCGYVIPETYADDYTSGKLAKKLCDVRVTDKNGAKTYASGTTIVPSVSENGDKVKVEYVCGGESLAQKDIPTVICRGDGKINGLNYFYGENIKTSYKNEEGNFYQNGVAVVSESDCGFADWLFANAQLAEGAELTFLPVADKALYDELVITFTDSADQSQKVSLSLKVKNAGTTATIGELSLEIAKVSLKTEEKFSVSYSDGRFIVGGIPLKVLKTDGGEDFNGFSSSLVYVRVGMKNAKEGARYLVTSVSGSELSRRNLDVFAPRFTIFGNLGGNRSIGEECELYPAVARDSFSPSTSLTLTVKGPDGEIVSDKNGKRLEDVPTDVPYVIILSGYGKYEAIYTMKEENWIAENELPISNAIFVIDEIAPKIRFKNAVVTTAKVGDVIVLPDFECKDNLTAAEDLSVLKGVVSPNGRTYILRGDDNSIQCSMKGTYKFIVLVTDEFGNASSITHVVTVTD